MATSPERIADVCSLLGLKPGGRNYDIAAEIASRGWPPFRIAQYLNFPEAEWRKLVGK